MSSNNIELTSPAQYYPVVQPADGKDGATINPNTSYNFKLAKVVSIFIISAGHILPIPGDWMIVTVGLFVFAFSSGYFTSARYKESFEIGPFWGHKLLRLGPDLLLTNALLLGLFLAEGQSGIWTWQSLVSILGIKGFVTWFGLNNPSPYGAGMWFLTVLLLFYAIYPVLRMIGRRQNVWITLLLTSFIASFVLQRYVQMGHMLWLTSLGFVFGMGMERLNLRLSHLISGTVAAVSLVLILILNMFLEVKVANLALLTLWCCSTVLWIMGAPRLVLRGNLAIEPLHASLLEIYLLHPYLTLHSTRIIWIDWLVSMGLVIAVSLCLCWLAKRLRRQLEKIYQQARAADSP